MYKGTSTESSLLPVSVHSFITSHVSWFMKYKVVNMVCRYKKTKIMLNNVVIIRKQREQHFVSELGVSV